MNTTQEALKASFIKLYTKKPYEKITIKELCLAAPAARTTFYEYYQNLAELKADIEDSLIGGILKLTDNNCLSAMEPVDLTGYFSKVLCYIKENWDVNYAFLVKQPNYEYMEKWKAAIKYHFKCRFPEKVNISNYNMIAEVIASGIIGAYVYWMKHPDEVDAAKLNQITVNALNALTKII